MAEKKKRAINRLQSMYPLRANIDNMYQKSAEASKAGKPTAWCMVNWWEADPILLAMDVELVYPENYGAACAALGVAQDYLERSDSDGFPTHMCGYARNCFGYAARMKELGEIPPEAPMGGMARPVLLVSSGALCDARIKWFQALGRYLDAPVWPVELPHLGVEESQPEGINKQAIDFMVKDLMEFVAFLEDLLKKKIYPAGDPKVSLKLYQDMYDEVSSRVENKIGAIAEEKYRLVFAELPPWHDLRIFDELAERGWNFVVESWAYHPPKPIDDYDRISNPLERIATQTYQWLTGYFRDALRQGEYMGYFAYPYLEYARTYQCDGALLHPLLTCRTATNHLPLVQDRLSDRLKVPSLVVEGDIVDLKLFNHADTMRRADAFEEIMDNHRKARKGEGLEW